MDNNVPTSEKNNKSALNFSGDEYNSIIVAATIGIWALEHVDNKPTRLICNEVMEDLIEVPHGTSPEECYTAFGAGLLTQSQVALEQYEKEIIANGRSEVTYKWRHRDGHISSVRCVGVLDRDFTEGIRFRGLHQDITNTTELEEKYRELSYEFEHDSQTGLYSRAAAEGHIRERIGGGQKDVALLLLDIDNLNTINNFYGTMCGDDVILGVADIMKTIGGIRKKDILGRFQGDGFIIMASDVKSEEDLTEWTQLFRKRLSEKRFGPKNNIIPTLSIGIAMSSDTVFTFSELFRRADVALHFAKNDGKNMVQFYSDEMKEFKLNDRIKELESTNSAMREQLEIVGAMAKVSFKSYLLDLNSNTIRVLKKEQGAIQEVMPLDLYLEKLVNRYDGADRERMFEICGTPDQMRALVKSREMYPFEYQGETGEGVRAHLVVINRENNGDARMLLWIMENIDAEKNRELAIRKAENERAMLFKSLASVALAIYRCEVRTDSAVLIHKDKDIDGAWHEETSVTRLTQKLYKETEIAGFANDEISKGIWNSQTVPDLLKDTDIVSQDVLTESMGWLRINVIAYHRTEAGIVSEYLIMLRKVDSLKQAELEKSKVEAERLALLSCISNTFNFMYRFDLKNGMCHELVAPDYLKKLLPKSCSIETARGIWESIDWDEDNYQQLAEFLDPNTISDRLLENNFITIDVQLREYGWAQIALSPMKIEDGVVTEVLWICRHIGKEKEQEMATKHMEQERMTILKSLSRLYFYIYHFDLENQTGVLINTETGAYGATEHRLDEAVQAFEHNLMTPEIAEANRDFWNFKTVAERMRNTDVLSREVFTKEYGWVRFYILAYHRNEVGIVTEILWMASSIDDQKKHELEMNAALESAFEDARQANMAKSRFLSAMSHDIRTPMNAVMGMIDIAKHHENNPEKIHEHLLKIETAGGQLLSLVNDILDISAIESGKLELRPSKCNVKAGFERVETVFRPQLEQRNQIGEFLIHDITYPWVSMDEVRVNQIVNNLLGNAIKYTGENGKITLDVCQKREKNNNVWLCITVRDTGIGMSKEFMEHMWETFSRATDTRINKIQGAGLGLSIVKDLVDAMGGTISADSEIDKGSSFTVKIPVKPVKHEVEVDLSREDEANDITLKVLVAEDNDMNWEIAKELLEINNIISERAIDGKKCLQEFTESPAGTYDAILMDMQMPVMNGLDATKAIRASKHPEAQTIPIIAMTANAFAEDVQRCIEAGMNDHLSKPIEISKVVATIKKYVTK